MLKPNFHQDETQSSIKEGNIAFRKQVQCSGMVFGLFQLQAFNWFFAFPLFSLIMHFIEEV